MDAAAEDRKVARGSRSTSKRSQRRGATVLIGRLSVRPRAGLRELSLQRAASTRAADRLELHAAQHVGRKRVGQQPPRLGSPMPRERR